MRNATALPLRIWITIPVKDNYSYSRLVIFSFPANLYWQGFQALNYKTLHLLKGINFSKKAIEVLVFFKQIQLLLRIWNERIYAQKFVLQKNC
jgi:hypothetical protein